MPSLIRHGDYRVFFAPLTDYLRWSRARVDQLEGDEAPAEDLRPLDPKLLLAAYDLALKRLGSLSKDGAYLALTEWTDPWEILVFRYPAFAQQAARDATPEQAQALADRQTALSAELGRLAVVFMHDAEGNLGVTVLDDEPRLPSAPDSLP